MPPRADVRLVTVALRCLGPRTTERQERMYFEVIEVADPEALAG
jgi:hypothetical protein